MRKRSDGTCKEGPPAEGAQRVSAGLAVRCGFPWRKTSALHDRRLRSGTRSFAVSCACKGSGELRGRRRRDGETPCHCRRDNGAVSIATPASRWSAISSTMTFSPLPSWSLKGPRSMPLTVRLVDILPPAPRPTRTAADSRAHPRRVQLLNISTLRCGGQGCRQDGHTRRCETGDEEGAQNLPHDAGRTAFNAGIEKDWRALEDNPAWQPRVIEALIGSFQQVRALRAHVSSSRCGGKRLQLRVDTTGIEMWRLP